MVAVESLLGSWCGEQGGCGLGGEGGMRLKGSVESGREESTCLGPHLSALHTGSADFTLNLGTQYLVQTQA